MRDQYGNGTVIEGAMWGIVFCIPLWALIIWVCRLVWAAL